MPLMLLSMLVRFSSWYKDMENITLGQIAIALAFIAALIVSARTISGAVSKAVKKGLSTELKPINDKLDSLTERIKDVDLNATKNFLVARIDEIENGHTLEGIEEERFWEEYQHYHGMGGNSYISHKVEQLQEQGKL